MPNANFSSSAVLNSALVKKFTWLARNDGTARSNRNTAISRIAITIVNPAADAANLNSRSARRDARASTSTSAGLASGPRTTSTPDQAMAFTAVDNLDLNPSGIGI